MLGSLKINSLSHTEELQRCPSPRSFPLQRPLLCALPRSVCSAGTARASDIGAGSRESSQQRVSGYFLFPSALSESFVPLTLSFTLVVSLCRFPLFPLQPVYLWLASSWRAAPGVERRSVGGRAAPELATWRSGPSHVGMTPGATHTTKEAALNSHK